MMGRADLRKGLMFFLVLFSTVEEDAKGIHGYGCCLFFAIFIDMHDSPA